MDTLPRWSFFRSNMRKHYVLFISPGTFISETSQKPIKAHSVTDAVKMAKGIEERHGAKPYGFQFITLLCSEPIDDGEGGTLKVEPKEVYRSGTYFITGDVVTLGEVISRNDARDSILVSNMRENDYPIIVENRNSFLSTVPFGEKDVIVDWQGNIVRRGDEAEFRQYRREKIDEHKRELAAMR